MFQQIRVLGSSNSGTARAEEWLGMAFGRTDGMAQRRQVEVGFISSDFRECERIFPRKFISSETDRTHLKLFIFFQNLQTSAHTY